MNVAERKNLLKDRAKVYLYFLCKSGMIEIQAGKGEELVEDLAEMLASRQIDGIDEAANLFLRDGYYPDTLNDAARAAILNLKE